MVVKKGGEGAVGGSSSSSERISITWLGFREVLEVVDAARRCEVEDEVDDGGAARDEAGFVRFWDLGGPIFRTLTGGSGEALAFLRS